MLGHGDVIGAGADLDIQVPIVLLKLWQGTAAMTFLLAVRLLWEWSTLWTDDIRT